MDVSVEVVDFPLILRREVFEQHLNIQKQRNAPRRWASIDRSTRTAWVSLVDGKRGMETDVSMQVVDFPRICWSGIFAGTNLGQQEHHPTETRWRTSGMVGEQLKTG
jgi:hypothetical protein